MTERVAANKPQERLPETVVRTTGGGSSSNVAMASLLQRDAAPGAGAGAGAGSTPASPNRKFTFDLGEKKGPKKSWKWVDVETAMKGKVTVEFSDTGKDATGPQTGVMIGKSGTGADHERTLAEQHVNGSIAGFQIDGAKEKLTVESTDEKFEAAIGAELKISNTVLPPLKGVAEAKFSFLNLNWKDPEDSKIVSTEAALGISAEPEWVTLPDGTNVKVSGALSFAATASPNKTAIAAEIAKRAGIEIAKDIAIDSAAVGAAAAPVLAIGAFAGLMIAGAMQTGKNIDASHAASGVGVTLRKSCRSYAKSYANAIAGKSAKGQGGSDGALRLNAFCAVNKITTEEGSKLLLEGNGGWSALYEAILKSARDSSYDQAVAKFEKDYEGEFGLLESIGDTWGMRGVFRRDLSRILYAND